MAVDFDFDGTFNDDDAEDENELEGFEGFDEDEDDEENEDEQPKRSPLRLILLALIVLILLCALCALVINTGLLPISIPGLSPAPTPPVQETPLPEPTDEEPLPPATEEPTEEPTVEPTEEATATTAPDTGPTVVIEPTEELPATTQPTQEPMEEPTLVPTEEPTMAPTEEPTVVITVEPTITSTATSVPVPGPTPTLGPTVIITVTSTTCDNNIPPIADAGGPYSAMRGKGVAVVNFDGSNSVDPDGTIATYEWDFGDGSDPESGETTTHGYNSIGSYEATLTVTDNCGATGQDTADVSIVGPTPPATGTPTTPTPEPSVTSTPVASATLGFCYRVQYGDTLSGIAWWYGVTWADLARVNGVPMHYFVIAGQGLFIPTGQIGQGPNVYEVQSGDTLNSVAFHCGLTTATLAQANGLTPNDSVSPGQMLIIPLWNR